MPEFPIVSHRAFALEEVQQEQCIDSMTSEMQRRVIVKGIVQSVTDVSHCMAGTDGRRIVRRIQANPICWSCQLRGRGSADPPL
ncbi:hypothetical protein TNCV_3522181 [Trichonephila clavipes]|uniref:Uncharacterized protein n=1 Tax=Trichonephila clavipes TaxID=2585209 RepID=A0A8X6W8W7_TRICX|nr:hypothetical protein TNCV_3522181 [Trichonephila clavipes]